MSILKCCLINPKQSDSGWFQYSNRGSTTQNWAQTKISRSFPSELRLLGFLFYLERLFVMIYDNRYSLADVRAVVAVFRMANEGFRDGVLHVML